MTGVKGQYNIVMKNIKRLYENNIRFNLKEIILKENIKDILLVKK